MPLHDPLRGAGADESVPKPQVRSLRSMATLDFSAPIIINALLAGRPHQAPKLRYESMSFST